MRAATRGPLGLLVLALLAVLAGLALWPDEEPPPAEATAPVKGSADPAAPPLEPEASPTGPTRQQGGRTYAPGQRTPLRRATTTSSPSASAPADEPAPGIQDKRPGASQGSSTLEAIQDRVGLVEDDIQVCLGQWMELDPDLEGRVVVGFQLDADGLQDAWIADHSEVPFGPLSCFSAAVYEVDWSGVSEDPVEVTFPFEFDAG